MGLGSLFARMLRGMFALWFAVVMVEPITVRACPTMGGVLEQVAPGSQPATMEHHRMASHDLAPHKSAPKHDHEESACNCISDCCGSIPAPLPILGTFVPVPARQLATAPEFPLVEHLFEEPDYLLPPATAPPTPHSAFFGA
jgi:hypothetical protein